MNYDSFTRRLCSLRMKLVSILVLISFTATSAGWAQPASGLVTSPKPVRERALSEPIRIPETLGEIQAEFRNGKGTPLVVLVQDAHAIIDAQENIQKLIAHLHSQCGINLVALEGGKGELDPTLFRAFPGDREKKRVFWEYLERGELSGAEIAAVFNPEEALFYGIEDWDLYEENYVVYLYAVQSKEKMLTRLTGFKNQLDKLQEKIYSSKLKEFHKHLETFREKNESLFDMLQYFSGLEFFRSPDSRRRIQTSYPDLAVLLGSLEQKESFPKESVEIEIRRLAEGFRKRHLDRLSPEELKNFNREHQAFLTSQSDPSSFLRYLVHAGTSLGLRPKLSPSLQELLGQTEALFAIKGTKLFDELEGFMEEAREELITRPEEKDLAAKYEKIHFLKELASLELTREQWENYEKDPEAYLSLFSEPIALSASSESKEREIVELIRPALEFYRVALQRDQAFHKNLKDLLQRKKASSVITLVGGFHTQGFEESLKESGFSYVVISPKMKSLAGKEAYPEVMQGKLSYKKYLKTTFYDAFVRDSTVKLVSGLDETTFRSHLKLWRDEIIRKLANEGRIAEAGEYTRYIDLLLKTYVEKFREGEFPATKEEILKAIKEELNAFRDDTVSRLWQRFEVQLKEFTQGLQALIENKSLTPKNVSSLIDQVKQTNPSGLVSLVRLPLMPEGPPIKAMRSELREFFETGKLPEPSDLSGPYAPLATREEVIKQLLTQAGGVVSPKLQGRAEIRQLAGELSRLGKVGEGITTSGEVKTSPDLDKFLRAEIRNTAAKLPASVRAEIRKQSIHEAVAGAVANAMVRAEVRAEKQIADGQGQQISETAGMLRAISHKLDQAEEGGLCVTGDTRLPVIQEGNQKSKVKNQNLGKSVKLSQAGENRVREIPITEVRPGDRVLSLNEETGKIEPRRINALLDMGTKPVYRLTTASGRSIKTTANHPYLVRLPSSSTEPVTRNSQPVTPSSRWIKVKKLRVGDELGVPNPGRLALDSLSGASLLHDPDLMPRHDDEGTAKDLERIISKKVAQKGNHRFYRRGFKPDQDDPRITPERKTVNVGEISIKGKENSVFLTGGVEDPFVFLLSKPLFPGPGNVIPLTPKILDDREVETLIGKELQLGKILNQELFISDNPGRIVDRRLDVLTSQFGVTVLEDSLRGVTRFDQLKNEVDRDPGAFDAGLAETDIRIRGNSFLKGIVSHLGSLQNEIYHALSGMSRNVGSANIAYAQDTTPFRPAPAFSDLLWDRIVSIEYVGREPVFDIEVDGTHNFIGNGIFAHNTAVGSVAASIPRPDAPARHLAGQAEVRKEQEKSLEVKKSGFEAPIRTNLPVPSRFAAYQDVANPTSVAKLPGGEMLVTSADHVLGAVLFLSDHTVRFLENENGQRLSKGTVKIATNDDQHFYVFSTDGVIRAYDAQGNFVSRYVINLNGRRVNIQGATVFEEKIYFTIHELGELRILDLKTGNEERFGGRETTPQGFETREMVLSNVNPVSRILYIVDSGDKTSFGNVRVEMTARVRTFPIDSKKLGDPVEIPFSFTTTRMAIDPDGKVYLAIQNSIHVADFQAESPGERYLGSLEVPSDRIFSLSVAHGNLMVGARHQVLEYPLELIPSLLIRKSFQRSAASKKLLPTVASIARLLPAPNLGNRSEVRMDVAGEDVPILMLPPETPSRVVLVESTPSTLKDLVTRYVLPPNAPPQKARVAIERLPDELKNLMKQSLVETLNGDRVSVLDYLTRQVDEVIFVPFIFPLSQNGQISGEWKGAVWHDHLKKPVEQIDLGGNPDSPGRRIIYVATVTFIDPMKREPLWMKDKNPKVISTLLRAPGQYIIMNPIDLVQHILEETIHMETIALAKQGRIDSSHYDRPSFVRFERIAKILRRKFLDQSFRQILYDVFPDQRSKVNEFIGAYVNDLTKEIANLNRELGLSPDDVTLPTVRAEVRSKQGDEGKAPIGKRLFLLGGAALLALTLFTGDSPRGPAKTPKKGGVLPTITNITSGMVLDETHPVEIREGPWWKGLRYQDPAEFFRKRPGIHHNAKPGGWKSAKALVELVGNKDRQNLYGIPNYISIPGMIPMEVWPPGRIGDGLKKDKAFLENVDRILRSITPRRTAFMSYTGHQSVGVPFARRHIPTFWQLVANERVLNILQDWHQDFSSNEASEGSNSILILLEPAHSPSDPAVFTDSLPSALHLKGLGMEQVVVFTEDKAGLVDIDSFRPTATDDKFRQYVLQLQQSGITVIIVGLEGKLSNEVLQSIVRKISAPRAEARSASPGGLRRTDEIPQRRSETDVPEGLCVTGDTRLPVIRREEAERQRSSPRRGQRSREAEKKTEDTLVKEIPITEVRPGDRVLSLNEETGKIEPRRINALLDMGVKPVYRLTTASGRSIKTTANHPYLVKPVTRNSQPVTPSSRWIKVKELRVGDEIGVPISGPASYDGRWQKRKGEGGTSFLSGRQVFPGSLETPPSFLPRSHVREAEAGRKSGGPESQARDVSEIFIGRSQVTQTVGTESGNVKGIVSEKTEFETEPLRSSELGGGHADNSKGDFEQFIQRVIASAKFTKNLRPRPNPVESAFRIGHKPLANRLGEEQPVPDFGQHQDRTDRPDFLGAQALKKGRAFRIGQDEMPQKDIGVEEKGPPGREFSQAGHFLGVEKGIVVDQNLGEPLGNVELAASAADGITRTDNQGDFGVFGQGEFLSRAKHSMLISGLNGRGHVAKISLSPSAVNLSEDHHWAHLVRENLIDDLRAGLLAISFQESVRTTKPDPKGTRVYHASQKLSNFLTPKLAYAAALQEKGAGNASPNVVLPVPFSNPASELLWDRIISIEYVGREPVFDIEVDGTHNFIANGIFAHNTYTRAARAEVRSDRGLTRLERLLNTFVNYPSDHFPRTGSIADIHGNIEGLNQALKKLWDKKVSQVILTGDYMDRDPHSVKVYERVRKLSEEGEVVDGELRKTIPLMGNHDLMFILAMMGQKTALFNWLVNGGFTVLLEEEVGLSPLVSTILKGMKPNDPGVSNRLKSLDRSEVNHLLTAVTTNPQLKKIAKWMKTNLRLYHLDEVGTLRVHAGIPVGQDGKPALSYKAFNGLLALAQLEEEMAYSFAKNDPEADVFKFLNQRESPIWIRGWEDKVRSPEDFVDALGVASIIVGHTIQTKTKIVDKGRFILADRGMALSYLGQEAPVYMATGGLYIESQLPHEVASGEGLQLVLDRAEKARVHARRILEMLLRKEKGSREPPVVGTDVPAIPPKTAPNEAPILRFQSAQKEFWLSDKQIAHFLARINEDGSFQIINRNANDLSIRLWSYDQVLELIKAGKTVTMGRVGFGNNIEIDNRAILERHALLSFHQEPDGTIKIMITDLGSARDLRSKAKTYVGGVRIGGESELLKSPPMSLELNAKHKAAPTEVRTAAPEGGALEVKKAAKEIRDWLEEGVQKKLTAPLDSSEIGGDLVAKFFTPGMREESGASYQARVRNYSRALVGLIHEPDLELQKIILHALWFITIDRVNRAGTFRLLREELEKDPRALEAFIEQLLKYSEKDEDSLYALVFLAGTGIPLPEAFFQRLLQKLLEGDGSYLTLLSNFLNVSFPKFHRKTLNLLLQALKGSDPGPRQMVTAYFLYPLSAVEPLEEEILELLLLDRSQANLTVKILARQARHRVPPQEKIKFILAALEQSEDPLLSSQAEISLGVVAKAYESTGRDAALKELYEAVLSRYRSARKEDQTRWLAALAQIGRSYALDSEIHSTLMDPRIDLEEAIQRMPSAPSNQIFFVTGLPKDSSKDKKLMEADRQGKTSLEVISQKGHRDEPVILVRTGFSDPLTVRTVQSLVSNFKVHSRPGILSSKTVEILISKGDVEYEMPERTDEYLWARERLWHAYKDPASPVKEGTVLFTDNEETAEAPDNDREAQERALDRFLKKGSAFRVSVHYGSLGKYTSAYEPGLTIRQAAKAQPSRAETRSDGPAAPEEDQTAQARRELKNLWEDTYQILDQFTTTAVPGNVAVRTIQRKTHFIRRNLKEMEEIMERVNDLSEKEQEAKKRRLVQSILDLVESMHHAISASTPPGPRDKWIKRVEESRKKIDPYLRDIAGIERLTAIIKALGKIRAEQIIHTVFPAAWEEPEAQKTNLEVFRGALESFVARPGETGKTPSLRLDAPVFLIDSRLRVSINPEYSNPLVTNSTNQAVLEEIRRAVQKVLPTLDAARGLAATPEGRTLLQSLFRDSAVSDFILAKQHDYYEEKPARLREIIPAYLDDMLRQIDLDDPGQFSNFTDLMWYAHLKERGLVEAYAEKYGWIARQKLLWEEPGDPIALLFENPESLRVVVEGEGPADSNTVVIEKTLYQVGSGRREPGSPEGKRFPPEKIAFARFRGQTLMFYISRSHTLYQDKAEVPVHLWRYTQGFFKYGERRWIIKREPENIDDLPVQLSILLDRVYRNLQLDANEEDFLRRAQAAALLNPRNRSETRAVAALEPTRRPLDDHLTLKRYADPLLKKAREFALRTIQNPRGRGRREITYHNEFHFNELFGFLDKISGSLRWKNLVRGLRLTRLAIYLHDLGYFDSVTQKYAEGHEERSKQKAEEFGREAGLKPVEIKAVQYLIEKTKLNLGDSFKEEVARENRVYRNLEEAAREEDLSQETRAFLDEYFGPGLDVIGQNDDRELVLDTILGGRVIALADIYGAEPTYPYLAARLQSEFVHDQSPAAEKTPLDQVAKSPGFFDFAVEQRVKFIHGANSEGKAVPGFYDPRLSLFDKIPAEVRKAREQNTRKMKEVARLLDALRTGHFQADFEALKEFIKEGERLGIFNEEFARSLEKEIFRLVFPQEMTYNNQSYQRIDQRNRPNLPEVHYFDPHQPEVTLFLGPTRQIRVRVELASLLTNFPRWTILDKVTEREIPLAADEVAYLGRNSDFNRLPAPPAHFVRTNLTQKVVSLKDRSVSRIHAVLSLARVPEPGTGRKVWALQIFDGNGPVRDLKDRTWSHNGVYLEQKPSRAEARAVKQERGQATVPDDTDGLCVTGDTRLPVIQEGNQKSKVKSQNLGKSVNLSQAGENRVREIPITEVRPGDRVLSLNEETGKIEPRRINALLDMGTKPVYKLTTASGRSIKTTANHPYLVRLPSSSTEPVTRNSQPVTSSSRWIKVKKLRVGDELGVPSNRESDEAVNLLNGFSGRVFDAPDSQGRSRPGWSQELQERRSTSSFSIPSFFGINRNARQSEYEKEAAQADSEPNRKLLKKIAGQSDSKNRLRKITQELGNILLPGSAQWFHRQTNYNTLSDLLEGLLTPAAHASPVGSSIELSDLLWDRIISIEYVGREPVFDIEVDGTHNFIGNGIFAHNTAISDAPARHLAGRAEVRVKEDDQRSKEPGGDAAYRVARAVVDELEPNERKMIQAEAQGVTGIFKRGVDFSYKLFNLIERERKKAGVAESELPNLFQLIGELVNEVEGPAPESPTLEGKEITEIQVQIGKALDGTQDTTITVTVTLKDQMKITYIFYPDGTVHYQNTPNQVSNFYLGEKGRNFIWLFAPVENNEGILDELSRHKSVWSEYLKFKDVPQKWKTAITDQSSGADETARAEVRWFKRTAKFLAIGALVVVLAAALSGIFSRSNRPIPPTTVAPPAVSSPENVDEMFSKELGDLKRNEVPIPVKKHSDLGEYWHDEDGSWWLEYGSSGKYVHGPDLLSQFSLSKTVQDPNKPVPQMIEWLKPMNQGVTRFSDLEAIADVEQSKLEMEPRNINADLQLQLQLRRMVEAGVISANTFVILSHGHFMAGAAELAKAMTQDGRAYLFDVAVYFPKGEWLPKSFEARKAVDMQVQLWSEPIHEAKSEHEKNHRKWGGGIAVVLYGHRGDWDIDHFIRERKDFGRASIDPEQVFGSPGIFKSLFADNHLSRVVIVTEEPTRHPTDFRGLPLNSLKDGVFGDQNRDLYEYMKELASQGVEVEVLSGNLRPPVTPLRAETRKVTEEELAEFKRQYESFQLWSERAIEALKIGLKEHFAGESDEVTKITGMTTSILRRHVIPNSFDAVITRAVFHSYEGYQGEIRLSVKLLPEGKLQISLQDNGVGVSEDILKKLFQTSDVTTKASPEMQKLKEEGIPIKGGLGRSLYAVSLVLAQVKHPVVITVDTKSAASEETILKVYSLPNRKVETGPGQREEIGTRIEILISLPILKKKPEAPLTLIDEFWPSRAETRGTDEEEWVTSAEGVYKRWFEEEAKGVDPKDWVEWLSKKYGLGEMDREKAMEKFNETLASHSNESYKKFVGDPNGFFSDLARLEILNNKLGIIDMSGNPENFAAIEAARVVTAFEFLRTHPSSARPRAETRSELNRREVLKRGVALILGSLAAAVGIRSDEKKEEQPPERVEAPKPPEKKEIASAKVAERYAGLFDATGDLVEAAKEFLIGVKEVPQLKILPPQASKVEWRDMFEEALIRHYIPHYRQGRYQPLYLLWFTETGGGPANVFERFIQLIVHLQEEAQSNDPAALLRLLREGPIAEEARRQEEAARQAVDRALMKERSSFGFFLGATEAEARQTLDDARLALDLMLLKTPRSTGFLYKRYPDREEGHVSWRAFVLDLTREAPDFLLALRRDPARMKRLLLTLAELNAEVNYLLNLMFNVRDRTLLRYMRLRAQSESFLSLQTRLNRLKDPRSRREKAAAIIGRYPVLESMIYHGTLKSEEASQFLSRAFEAAGLPELAQLVAGFIDLQMRNFKEEKYGETEEAKLKYSKFAQAIKPYGIYVDPDRLRLVGRYFGAHHDFFWTVYEGRLAGKGIRFVEPVYGFPYTGTSAGWHIPGEEEQVVFLHRGAKGAEQVLALSRETEPGPRPATPGVIDFLPENKRHEWQINQLAREMFRKGVEGDPRLSEFSFLVRQIWLSAAVHEVIHALGYHGEEISTVAPLAFLDDPWLAERGLIMTLRRGRSEIEPYRAAAQAFHQKQFGIDIEKASFDELGQFSKGVTGGDLTRAARDYLAKKARAPDLLKIFDLPEVKEQMEELRRRLKAIEPKEELPWVLRPRPRSEVRGDGRKWREKRMKKVQKKQPAPSQSPTKEKSASRISSKTAFRVMLIILTAAILIITTFLTTGPRAARPPTPPVAASGVSPTDPRDFGLGGKAAENYALLQNYYEQIRSKGKRLPGAEQIQTHQETLRGKDGLEYHYIGLAHSNSDASKAVLRIAQNVLRDPGEWRIVVEGDETSPFTEVRLLLRLSALAEIPTLEVLQMDDDPDILKETISRLGTSQDEVLTAISYRYLIGGLLTIEQTNDALARELDRILTVISQHHKQPREEILARIVDKAAKLGHFPEEMKRFVNFMNRYVDTELEVQDKIAKYKIEEFNRSFPKKTKVIVLVGKSHEGIMGLKSDKSGGGANTTEEHIKRVIVSLVEALRVAPNIPPQFRPPARSEVRDLRENRKPLRATETGKDLLGSPFLDDLTVDSAITDLSRDGYDPSRTSGGVWLPRAEARREQFRLGLGNDLDSAMMEPLRNLANAEAIVDEVFDSGFAARSKARLKGYGRWGIKFNGLFLRIQAASVGSVLGGEAVAAPVSVAQVDLDQARGMILETLQAIGENKVIDFEIPSDLGEGEARSELLRELLQTVQNVALLNDHLSIRLRVSSLSDERELNRLLGRMSDATVRKHIKAGQILIVNGQGKVFLDTTGRIDIAVTSQPFKAINESWADSAFNSKQYADGKPILYKGSDTVTPSELFLAAVAALSQKTVEGLVRQENNIIEAQNRNAFSLFRIIVQTQMLAELARQAMARAA